MRKMKQAIAWMRVKAGTFLAKATVGRLAAPVGVVTAAAAAWTADPVSWRRVVAALAAMLLGPLFAFVPVKAVVARRSNTANAVMLFLLVALDTLCAAWAVRWSIDSWLSALVAVVLVAFGLFYNVWLMTLALKLEER